MIPLDDLTESDFKRFFAKVVIGEHWHWVGWHKAKGYGRFRVGKHIVAAHRVSYAYFYGDPGPLHIDHTCRVLDCVNPNHLEAVTHEENERRKQEARKK